MNLAAYAIRMAPPEDSASDRRPFLFYLDALMDTDRLPPLPLSPNQRSAVTAAIFVDGTTAGEEDLLGRLLLRRSNMLQAVELARKLIVDAGSRNVPQNQLVQQFRTMADS